VLLSTVRGWVEDLARRGGVSPVAVGLLVAAVKMAGAILRPGAGSSGGRRLPQRPLQAVAAVASGLLVLYGAVLVVAGVLVLTDAVTPAATVDQTALRWHVFCWDAWFLLWGLLLGLAVISRRRDDQQTAAT
jgi:hypothetical protein